MNRKTVDNDQPKALVRGCPMGMLSGMTVMGDVGALGRTVHLGTADCG